MTFQQFAARANAILVGRVPFWIPSEKRRNIRYEVVSKYFEHFLPAAAKAIGTTPDTIATHAGSGGNTASDKNTAPATTEKIFSLWLQGEQNAPPLIEACYRSIRHNCPEQQFVVLDEKSLSEYIDLPGVIMDKYRREQIRRAHFADIVRVELLHNHGGFWLDSTCFVTSPIPQFIVDQDFFVFMAGSIRAASHIQNCFIRARRGAPLLEGWRAMIHEYWMHEPNAIDYFMHQLLFKKLVQNNPRAIELFDHMPHVSQDPTHAMWWSAGMRPFDRSAFEQLTANSFFQKTSYRSAWAQNPPDGSLADEMFNRMYR
jgi:hypothetical protein